MLELCIGFVWFHRVVPNTRSFKNYLRNMRILHLIESMFHRGSTRRNGSQTFTASRPHFGIFRHAKSLRPGSRNHLNKAPHPQVPNSKLLKPHFALSITHRPRRATLSILPTRTSKPQRAQCKLDVWEFLHYQGSPKNHTTNDASPVSHL